MEYAGCLKQNKMRFRLDPRTKVAFMALITTLLFFVYENMFFVTVLAFIPFCFLMIIGQKKLSITYGILFLLSILAKQTQNTMQLPTIINSISVLLVALVMRFFPAFMMAYYIILSTEASEFIVAMEKVHISENFIIPITVIFRFIPTINEEYRFIKDAMKMRGIQFGSKKNFLRPGTLLEYRYIPLLMSIVKIGDELSAAALTRGLGAPIKRTHIAKVEFCIYDLIILIISIILLGMYFWIM